MSEGENPRGSTKCPEHFAPPLAPEGAGARTRLSESRSVDIELSNNEYFKLSTKRTRFIAGFLYLTNSEGENPRGSTKCMEHFAQAPPARRASIKDDTSDKSFWKTFGQPLAGRIVTKYMEVFSNPVQ